MSLIDHSKSKFRFDINALRALAVVLVVLYHFDVRGFSVGFIGVDVFFVISGYLMTQILLGTLEKNNFNYFKFIFARIKRIWPALVVLVLVLCGLGSFLLPQSDYVSFAAQARDALFFISNIEFAKGLGYFTTNVEERWFLHSWSLSVEWQFYCIYPFILFGLWKLCNLNTARDQKRHWLVIALLFLSIVSYSYSIHLTKQNQPLAFFSLSTRAWEMMMGGIVFLLTHTAVGQWCRQHASALKWCCVLLFASCFALGHGGAWVNVWPGSNAAIPVIATALYILAGASNKFWQFFENHKLTQALGRWSYSIYLWHWAVVIAIHFIGLSVIPQTLKVFGIALSLLFGFMSFKWVESSFRDSPSGVMPLVLKISGIYLLALLSVMYVSSYLLPVNGKPGAAVATLKLPKAYENIQLMPDAALKVYTLNPDQPRNILVIGDSHAEHLFPWFKSYVSHAAVSFAVTNGCPPVPGMNRFDTTGWYCHKSFEKIRQLTLHKKYDVIILSGNWYAVDRDKPGGNKPGICAVSLPHCGPEQKSKNKAFAVQSLSAFVDALSALNIPVVIVRPTPFAELAIGKLAERYQVWGLTLPSEFVDRDWQTNYGDSLLDEVLNQVKNPSMVYQADLRPVFCKSGVCQYFDENHHAIFWDDNHFTQEWIIRHGGALNVVNNILKTN